MTHGAQADDLERLDHALLALRRFLDPPALIDDQGQRVELSTLLVLEALVAGGDGAVVDVARMLSVTHSTASRLVKRATDVGAVERRADAEDQRRTVLQPTAAGRALRERAASFRRARIAAVLEGWDAEERRGFADALARFATGAAAAGNGGAG